MPECTNAKLAAAIAVICAATSIAAQEYPVKPVRIIIPAGPGGGIDTIIRAVGQPLVTALGQPIIMDNRPGAGTMLGSELTAKAAADGYTLLGVTISHAINAAFQKNLPYDPINDFAEITLGAYATNLLVVHPSVPVKSTRDVVALAKKYPGQLFYASAGTGSGTHLAFELFQSMASVKLTHVPYKSGTAALTDLIGGHVQLMFSNTINAGPHVRSRRLNALAISALKRSPLFPGLPTIAESGVPGYSSDTWHGVLAPAKTPRDVIARLNREIVAILRSDEVKAKLAAQGFDIAATTPEEFSAFMRSEIAKWRKVAATLKIEIN